MRHLLLEERRFPVVAPLPSPSEGEAQEEEEEEEEEEEQELQPMQVSFSCYNCFSLPVQKN
jgi:CO dehydrogenase/acetyl-CoA synthase beta subunit